jgi:RNA polymerase sigma factor (sigma-70 family)
LPQLFRAERRRLVRLISRIVGNPAVAEELAQDAFLRLWRRPEPENARGFLFQTARNLAIDHVRAHRVGMSYVTGVAVEQVRSEPPSPEITVGARQELEMFLSALRSLPDRAQRAFLLNRLDGLTYREISRALGVSVSTVEKDIARALELCRKWVVDAQR